MKKLLRETIQLEKIVGGGQALGTLADGRKAFVWGGLPGETVEVEFAKQKRTYVEGVVTDVVSASAERLAPKDPGSYLSTSPWQIMSFAAEQAHKQHLIDEAFELHGVTLPHQTEIYSNDQQYAYRNKVEFSFWWDNDSSQLDLAFFRRGSHGKVPVDGTSLARPEINQLALTIRDILRTKAVEARSLKTLMIRCDQQGNCVFQLYVKDSPAVHSEPVDEILTEADFEKTGAQGGEVIYSDHRSPASVITKRLATYGNPTLTDAVLGVPFHYACEGFFQVNIPVYEQALRDMSAWVTDSGSMQQVAGSMEAAAAGTFGTGSEEGSAFPAERGKTSDQLAPSESSEMPVSKMPASNLRKHPTETPDITDEEKSGDLKHAVVDFYSGVGSIGFTIGGDDLTLVELNPAAVAEMRRNRAALGKKATVVEASAETSLDYISADAIIIVDPPRAGLHDDVTARLLEVQPPRIIYLSCNPVTQARDVSRLLGAYRISAHRGYNFFPRTPHIEHLVVLELL